MKTRTPFAAAASSPTLVGSVTTLIVIVAVFLAYNANTGLPFVPVYRVAVEVPNAARLVDNNEVRIGGTRVGVVESIVPVLDDDGARLAQANGADGIPGSGSRAVARLNLKLDKSIGSLPQDSLFRVRYRSAFGLKYLEIVRGHGPAAPPGFIFDGTNDGDICAPPITVQAPDGSQDGCFQGQTEFDDINSTFDAPTREAVRDNLLGFGNGFAARGGSLNEAIAGAAPLFRSLEPVGAVLANERTYLRRFFPELGDTARIVAPVAAQQAQLFSNAARAFAAISEDVGALQEAIAKGPPTLEAGIETLPRQRPFLHDFALLSHELRPGVGDLGLTLPVLNEAIEVGTPVLRRSPRLNQRLAGAFSEVKQLVSRPTTKLSLARLGETFDTVRPLARYVAPAQTVCNYWNYFFTLISEHISERDQVGYQERVAFVLPPPGDITVDSSPLPLGSLTIPGEVETPLGGYSGLSANGRASVVPNPAGAGVFKPYELPIRHDYVYDPHGEDGDEDCQAGQDGYVLGEYLLPGQPKSDPSSIALDLPGSRGPTDVYWREDGVRELRDTRVASRQPESWEGNGR